MGNYLGVFTLVLLESPAALVNTDERGVKILMWVLLGIFVLLFPVICGASV